MSQSDLNRHRPLQLVSLCLCSEQRGRETERREVHVREMKKEERKKQARSKKRQGGDINSNQEMDSKDLCTHREELAAVEARLVGQGIQQLLTGLLYETPPIWAATPTSCHVTH